MKTNKNFLKKLTAGILGFVMTLGVGAAGFAASAGETQAANTWTSVSTLSVGDVIVIANDTAKRELTGVASNIGTATNYTTAGSPNGTYELTVEAGSEANSYSFKNGSNYLAYSSTGNNLNTSTTKDKKSSWTINGNSAGNIRLYNCNSTTRRLVYNSGSPRFCCYTSDQAALTIFKKNSGGTVNVTGVTVSPTTASLDVGSTTTLTATVVPSNATNKNVTWESGNNNVATVSDGVVTGVSVGSTTITVKTVDGNKTATCNVKVTSGGGGGGDSYQIVFATGSGDGSGLSTSTEISNVISTGATYVSSITAASQVYYNGGSGLKVGKSNGAGSVTFALSVSGSVSATSVVVNAKRYNSTKAATISINDESSQDLTGDFADYTFSIDDDITSLSIATSNYSWVSGITVNYESGEAKTLNSITGIDGTLSASESDAEFDLSGLTAKGTLSDDTSTIVDISKYVTLTTAVTPSSVGAGTHNVSVTVTPKTTGSVSAQAFNVSATVLASPIYDKNINDDLCCVQDSGVIYADSIWGDDLNSQETEVIGKKLRLSSSEYFGSSNNYTSVLGDYNGSGNGAWANFSGTNSNASKYYSAIANAIPSASYGFAMYSQNFAFNKPNAIEFSWTAVSGLSGTSNAYIVVSTNGGYSWTSIQNVSNLGTNQSISWAGSTYSNTNNVLVGLAFTSSTTNGQLRNIQFTVYGDSLSETNVWAVRKINITGNNTVEAEKTITLSASVETNGYETPANTGITWSSSNPTVAIVNASTGVVTGVSEGTATITATAADGKGASQGLEVSVTPKQKALSSITLNTDNVTKSFVKGSTFNYTGLVVTANYSNGFDSETVTPTSVTPPNMNTVGNDKIVTVSYTLNNATVSATYEIDITPVVSSEITISGTGIALNQTSGHYEVTTAPEAMIELTVEYNGDESSYSVASDNENIEVSEDVLYIYSEENDSGTVTFSVGNATAILDVTVVADESATQTPLDGALSGIVGQTLDFSVNLVNATSAEWSISDYDEDYISVDGTGDATGYIGEVELLDICSSKGFTVSVTTSKDTYEFNFSVTAVATQLTDISVNSDAVDKEYILGDEFDPEGLVVTGTFDNGKTRPLTSDEYTLSKPDMFSVNDAETVTVTSKEGSFTGSFTIKIATQTVTSRYEKISSVSDITEGDYIIAYDRYAFTSLDSTSGGYSTVTIIDNVIAQSADVDKLAVHITPVSGGYTLKTSSTNENNPNKFINYTSGSNTLLFSNNSQNMGISLSSSSTHKDTGGLFAIGGNGTTLDNVLAFSTNRFRFYKSSTTSGTTNYKPVDLYKKYTSGTYDVIKIDAELTTDRTLYEGTTVSPADFAPISVLLNDGNPATELTDAEYSKVLISYEEGNALKEGDNIVTLSYEGRSVEVPVNNVQKQTKEVDSISLGVKTGTTAKTSYIVKPNETPAWDFTNIEITIKYKTGEDDEVLTIAQAQTLYGATISPDIPTVGTDGFNVSMTVLGVSIGDNGHFSATVSAYGPTGINDLNRTSSNQVLNYFEGQGFNTAGINSLTLDMNDGGTTNIKKEDFAANNVKLGLVKKTTDTSLAKEITDGTVLPSDYDGYYLAVTYGDFIKVTRDKINVTKSINNITVVKGDPIKDTYTYTPSNASTDPVYSNKSNLSATLGDANVPVNFTYSKYNNYTGGDEPNFMLGDKNDGFTGTLSASNLNAEITKITVLGGTNNNDIYASYTISGDGITTTTKSNTSANTKQSIEFAVDHVDNFTIEISNSKIWKFYGLIIEYETPNEITYSNQDAFAQHVALEYAAWCIENISADASDAKWAEAISKYNVLVTNNDKLSAQQKELINNMFRYATASSGSSADDIQKCVALYDAYIAKYNYGGNQDKNFLGRTVEGTLYTVTLNATENGGTCETTTIQMKYGEAYTDLPAATKDGYTFIGWYTSKSGNTPVSTFTGTDNNTVIYAQFKKAYSITLNTGSPDATGGSLSTNSYSVSDTDQYITVTDPTREGYHVVGYTMSVDNVEFDFESRTLTIPAGKYGQITLTAQWEANDHTATLNYNNGSDAVVIPTKYDGTLDLSEYSPTKDGYYLSGWVDGNGKSYKVDDVISIKGDIELTAQWTEVTCTLDYSIGYQFTGLDITKFEFIFTGTYEGENVEEYGFMICQDEAALKACMDSQDTEGTGIKTFVCEDGEAKCVAGVSTEKSDKVYYVVFYFVDDQGTHYSVVLEISIDGVLSDNYDTSSITDKYAKAAVDYYIYTLTNK